MKIPTVCKKYENCIVVLLTILVNIALMSICFDFYYDLNDDVMMKDIMAGVYTGTPDGHNMQTLYVLGAFISLCYRLCRSIPWYGLFLFLCQMGSLYLIGIRLLRICRTKKSKAGCMVLLTVFLWGIILSHMIAIQYTITCTILAATAIFLFMTTEKGLTAKAFVVRNIPSILLVIVAYQLRTEMLLLVFPLICLAGLFRWVEEERFFQKENYQKYGIVIGCILAGMVLSRLVDFAAYGSEEWKAFLTFFDKRTEVYDFHYDVLTSGEHKEYLASIGLNDAKQELLSNYNFGLDEEIDEKVLSEIADYAAETDTTISAGLLYEKGKLYLYRTLHSGDRPYNWLVLTGYLSVVICGIATAVSAYGSSAATRKNIGMVLTTGNWQKGRWAFLWELVLLGVVRTVLWMYILMRGRDPVRITHSLYLAEFMVLMGMLLLQIARMRELMGIQEGVQEKQDNQYVRDAKKGKLHKVISLLPVLFGLLFICCLPQSIHTVKMDKQAREEANEGALAIDAYCRAHPEQFYFEDVYSTVGFSQKIFENVDNSLANYDIMGGWMCKSPLYREKLEQFGITTMAEGLLDGEVAFFIMETGTPDSNTDWIQDYYEAQGKEVSIRQVDMIGEKYGVYQIID